MSKRKERQAAWWASKTPEEQAEIRKSREARRKKRERNEAWERAKQERKNTADRLGRTAKPGDWIRYQDGGFGGLSRLFGRICRIKAWDDDGWNDDRAGRNKKIIVEIEPHLHDRPETIRTNFYGFSPITEMEVIAEAAR